MCHKEEHRENIDTVSHSREGEAASHCVPVGSSLNVFGYRFEVGIVISARSQNEPQVFSFGSDVHVMPNGVETLESLGPSCQISGVQRDIDSFRQVELEPGDENIFIKNCDEKGKSRGAIFNNDRQVIRICTE